MNGQVKVIVIGTGGHAKVVAETVSISDYSSSPNSRRFFFETPSRTKSYDFLM